MFHLFYALTIQINNILNSHPTHHLIGRVDEYIVYCKKFTLVKMNVSFNQGNLNRRTIGAQHPLDKLQLSNCSFWLEHTQIIYR